MKFIYIYTFLVFITACNKERIIDTTTNKHRKIYDLSYKQVDHVQSPINLQSSLAKDEKHHINLHINPRLTALKQKAHTIELKMTDDSYVKSNEKLYIFKQLHFHTPAEHSIDSDLNPMEMHLVSVLLDSLGMESQKYLVIGITFKEGKKSPFIEAVINKFPQHKDGKLKHNEEDVLVRFPDDPISLNSLFEGEAIENKLNELFHYKGSLTTPRYTETVQWYILKHSIEASKAQIELMTKQMVENARAGQQKTHLENGFGNLTF